MRFEWVIGVGLLLAVAIGGITVLLTREHFTYEQPRDFESVEAASAEMQDELTRLYYRYEDRLVTIADLLHRYSRSPFPAEREATRVVGVMTVSLLDFDGTQETQHREIRASGQNEEGFDRDRFPVLRLQGDEVEPQPPGTLQVSADWFEIENRESGWVRNIGEVLYFWKKMNSGHIAVVGIDAVELRASISQWFRDQKEMRYHSLFGGFTRLLDPSRDVIWEGGKEPEYSVIPRTYSATSQVGTWQLEASGAVTTGIIWNVPFLVAGLGLSVLVLIVAMLSAFALRRATKLAERRVTFVNSVSHELRTPITNILLNTDIAKDILTEDPVDAALHLERVSDETSRLSRLVDNVLTFSRKEKGGHRLRPTHFDPNEVVEEVSANFHSLFERAGIEVCLNLAAELEIEADRDALAQILTNLFSNAEKYASTGMWFHLESERESDAWRLCVSDRGPGIQLGSREKIFEPFRRAGDSISEGVTGTGLGLTIARDLAAEMKGDLRLIDSETGATFELVLPLSNS